MDAVVAAQNFVALRARGRGVKRGLHASRVVAKIHRPFFKHDLIASLAACYPILSAERFSRPLQATPPYPHKSLCLALPVRAISLSPATLSQ